MNIRKMIYDKYKVIDHTHNIFKRNEDKYWLYCYNSNDEFRTKIDIYDINISISGEAIPSYYNGTINNFTGTQTTNITFMIDYDDIEDVVTSRNCEYLIRLITSHGETVLSKCLLRSINGSSDKISAEIEMSVSKIENYEK